MILSEMARNLREAEDDGGEEEFDYGEEPNFEVLEFVVNHRLICPIFDGDYSKIPFVGPGRLCGRHHGRRTDAGDHEDAAEGIRRR